jgi:hypothetical protein
MTPQEPPFEYVETRDPAVLFEYVELRRRAFFSQYKWLPEDFGVEDETDHASQVVVAVKNGVVAGGARLTISTPEHPRALPLEETSFRLKNCPQLAQFELDRRPYGEISRMAADPDCARGFEVSSGLGNALCASAAAQGLDIVFSICPELPARINQRNAKRRGVGFLNLMELPTVFGVNMWLCVFTGLQNVYRGWEREAA